MIAGVSEERVREIAREEIAARLARPERTINVAEAGRLMFTRALVEEFSRRELSRLQSVGAAGATGSGSPDGDDPLLKHVDGVDDSHVEPGLRIRPGPGLADSGELVEQDSRDAASVGDISGPQSTEGVELRHLPPELARVVESVTAPSGHHGLLTVHGLVTRYVTGAFLAAIRSLHCRQWVRRAVPSVRPSGTTGGDTA